MATKRSSSHSKGSWLFLAKELPKLDWRVVNRKTEKPFKIVLLGSPDEQEQLMTMLFSFPHYSAQFFKDLLPQLPSFDRTHSEPYLIHLSDLTELADVINQTKDSLFILTMNSNLLVHTSQIPVFNWQEMPEAKTIHKMLDQFSGHAFALSFVFPLFRRSMIEREIKQTAMQNTTWVVSTSLPNLIPGPHQIFTAPFEAASDFVVLTINEFKLMMALTGLLGQKVQPLKLWMQASVVLAMAKTAQVSATQIISKVPAGGGLIVKGAVSYAFTRAMGEAIVLTWITGRVQSLSFFKNRLQAFMAEGKAIAGRLIKPR